MVMSSVARTGRTSSLARSAHIIHCQSERAGSLRAMPGTSFEAGATAGATAAALSRAPRRRPPTVGLAVTAVASAAAGTGAGAGGFGSTGTGTTTGAASRVRATRSAQPRTSAMSTA